MDGRLIRVGAVGALVGIGVCTWSNAPVALAATIEVTITSDTTDGGDGQTSLREAFAAANASPGGDTIVLEAAQAYTLADCLNGPLRYDEDETLVIEGNGSSITQTCDATRLLRSQAAASIIELHDLHLVGGPNAGPVSVDGMAVQAGSLGRVGLYGVEISGFDTGGGSVLETGSGHETTPYFVSVVDSDFHDNTGTVISGDNPSILVQSSSISDNDGSAISVADGYPLVVEDATVSNNTGAGISSSGQGFAVNALTITGSTVSGNGVVGVSCSQCGTLTITDTTVSGNGSTSPSLRRGGVWITLGQRSTTEPSLLAITDSTISGNHSEDGGGGGVTALVTFIEDPAALPPLTTITGGVIDGNDTTADGGGVSVVAGTLTIDGTVISDNDAIGDGGGVAYGDPTGPYDLSIEGANITGNSAGDDGGGVYSHDAVAVAVTGTTVSANTAAGRGGGILANTTSLLIEASRLSGNDAADGGGFWYAGDGLAVRRSTIDANTVGGDGGGAFIDVVGFVAIENVTAVGNGAGRGGAFAFAAGGATVGHVTASGNDAVEGAHIWQGSGTLTIVASALVAATTAACDVTAPAAGGWSFYADGTCGSTATDVVSAADPELAVLADNGGPTPTMLPAPTSPLGGLVPAASCALAVDQRGTARPQGAGCDAGAVEIVEALGVAPIVGGPGADVLMGTSQADTILAMGGHDVVFGLGGADAVEGGSGNDTLFGGDGADALVGGPGADILVGGPASDQLTGGPGRDLLIAGPGDNASGGPGPDICFLSGSFLPVDC